MKKRYVPFLCFLVISSKTFSRKSISAPTETINQRYICENGKVSILDKKTKAHIQHLFKKITHSIWFFPTILTIVFLTLVCLNINGSSIGVYHNALYGKEIRDNNLLFGKPKPIRSDEWLGWTQDSAMQKESGYPAYNTNLGNDGDISKNPEIPVGGWVAIFRPANWSYFFLPFTFAFSFKWWVILYLLVLSGYFFTLRVLPDKKLLSALLSTSFALSPFILWWYQSILFLSLACGFLIAIVGMRIINQEALFKIKSRVLSNSVYVILLAFLGSVLGLTLYPPFALPILLVTLAFLFGYFIDSSIKQKFNKKRIILRLLPFIIAGCMAGIIGLMYILGHHDMITKTAESIYPGSRRTVSGTLPIIAVFDGFLMPLLQISSRGGAYYVNQSEASNFILSLPFLIVSGILIQILYYIQNKRISWTFALIQICSLVFLVRALVPVDSIVYHVLFLDRVPNERLKSGLGFAGFLQLIYIIKLLPRIRLSRRFWAIIIATFCVLCFAILSVVGIYIMSRYPLFLHNYAILILLSTVSVGILALFLANKPLWGAALLFIFTIGSTFWIIPLYRGLDFFENSIIVNKIKEVSKPGDRWITTDNLYYINLPLVAGRAQISGSQNYPDPELWSQVGGSKYEKIYNRQARALFVTDINMKEKMKLIAPNYFQIKFECSDFIFKNVDYVLSVSKISDSCVKLVDTVIYPKQNFYIYSIESK